MNEFLYTIVLGYLGFWVCVLALILVKSFTCRLYVPIKYLLFPISLVYLGISSFIINEKGHENLEFDRLFSSTINEEQISQLKNILADNTELVDAFLDASKANGKFFFMRGYKYGKDIHS